LAKLGVRFRRDAARTRIGKLFRRRSRRLATWLRTGGPRVVVAHRRFGIEHRTHTIDGRVPLTSLDTTADSARRRIPRLFSPPHTTTLNDRPFAISPETACCSHHDA